MMRYLFLILVLILPISLLGQTVYTAKSMSLKGNVKTVVEDESYPPFCTPITYFFDTQGRLLTYTLKGLYTIQFEYDSSDYPTKAVVISHDGIKRHMTFETDATHSFWKEIMREKGKLTEEKEYQFVSPTKTIYIYRNHPVEVVSSTAYHYTDSTQTRISYTIDERNNQKEVYTYNVNGDKVTMKRYDLTSNKCLESYRYVYQYDDKGNWNQSTEYEVNTTYPMSVTHRKITYYN